MTEVFLIQGLSVDEFVVISFLRRRSVNFDPEDHPRDLADYATLQLGVIRLGVIRLRVM